MKEEIVEGLRYALSKGDSLEKAMMSFFSAGYSKEDIEEAAGFVNAPTMPSTQQGQQTSMPVSRQEAQDAVSQSSQSQQTQPLQQPQPNVVQRVSEYGSKPSSSGKAVTIILIVLLVLLVGVLVSVFLFREQLADFLNSLLA